MTHPDTLSLISGTSRPHLSLPTAPIEFPAAAMPLDHPDLDEERAGFFKPFSQSVMRSLSAVQWTGFCGLTSHEQRVTFVYDLPEVKQVALQHVFKGKDEAEAKARKDEGNKFFSEGNYAAAMRCYSQAMAKAPYKGEKGRGNRTVSITHQLQ